MYYLSAAYFGGVPDLIKADDKAALSLLEKSAEKGSPEAQFSLGWQYESGAKVKADPERAFRLYESAARQGYSLAVSRLIRVFSNGELGKSPDAKQVKLLAGEAASAGTMMGSRTFMRGRERAQTTECRSRSKRQREGLLNQGRESGRRG